MPLDPDGYRYVAETMRGAGVVTLRIREIDDDGDYVWESGTAQLRFSREDVQGGLYYWTTTDPFGEPSGRIMRVDFGWESQEPEEWGEVDFPEDLEVAQRDEALRAVRGAVGPSPAARAQPGARRGGRAASRSLALG